MVKGESKSLKCEICGKVPQWGHNVSHSKRRTNKRSDPNVHPALITVDGKTKRMNICTRCLRTAHKTEVKTSAA